LIVKFLDLTKKIPSIKILYSLKKCDPVVDWVKFSKKRDGKKRRKEIISPPRYTSGGFYLKNFYENCSQNNEYKVGRKN